MSFSIFLTGTVLASSAALTGLLASPRDAEHRAASLAWVGALALVAVGFVGGWVVAG